MSDSSSIKSDPIQRVAVWSGPRNISTALMRSWENRSDTFVTDEPLYAHYLAHTRLEHPGRDDIVTAQSTDWREVVEQCTDQRNGVHSVHYQKHMTHHLLPHIELEWLAALTNIFLIRSPQQVVASYAKARPDLTPADLGFEQQHRLYKHIMEYIDSNPLICVADDVLRNPQQALTAMCQKSKLEFDVAMLQWPAGRRDTDGVWAPHWYASVEKSTGFAPYVKKETTLNARQQEIADLCEPFYSDLYERRLQFSG